MTGRTLWLLPAFVTGCLGDIAGDEVGSTTAAALAPVTWTRVVGASVVDGFLTKTSGVKSWDAGASSVERFARDGFVEFTTLENTTSKLAGLTYVNHYEYDWDTRYAIHLKANGIVAIRERGDIRDGDVGPYQAGDVFRVQVVGGVVTYWQNGALLYTSSESPIRSLVFDCSLRTPGATIRDVVIETHAFWTGAVGTAADGTSLTKTAAGPDWNAGARSIGSLQVDGYADFTTGENTTAKMAGLSNGDGGTGYEDIDFAVFLGANGVVGVREGGVTRGTFGPYAAGDIFRVAVSGGVVTYARNGAVFYTSSRTASFPLLLDTSLRTAGATIEGATLFEFPGPAIVFDNPAGAFVWTPSTYGYDEYTQGAYLDLTRAAAEQTGAPSLAGIEFFKRWSEENITPGGMYFRSWRNPDGPPRGASFAAGDDVVLFNPEYDWDNVYRAPQVKAPGDAVGSADRWVSGEPSFGGGVQAGHFQDPCGCETPPSATWFTSGIVGVRFRSGGLHYGFVELVHNPNGGNERDLYIPVRWGYNPVPNQPVLIPP